MSVIDICFMGSSTFRHVSKWKPKVMDFYQRSRACYKHLKLEQSPGYADLLVNMGRLEAQGPV